MIVHKPLSLSGAHPSICYPSSLFQWLENNFNGFLIFPVDEVPDILHRVVLEKLYSSRVELNYSKKDLVALASLLSG